jgi:hypothetical protein
VVTPKHIYAVSDIGERQTDISHSCSSKG